MEQQLRDLCAEHGLTAISVSFLGDQHPFTVYLHWQDRLGARCASGFGTTVDDAVVAARADMARMSVDQPTQIKRVA